MRKALGVLRTVGFCGEMFPVSLLQHWFLCEDILKIPQGNSCRSPGLVPLPLVLCKTRSCEGITSKYGDYLSEIHWCKAVKKLDTEAVELILPSQELPGYIFAIA